MTSNEIDTLISKAQRALQSGDKKTAGQVIHQILKEDFTNVQAWQLLHQLFNDSSSLDDFKIQFAQKYYPDKVNLLQAVSEQRANKSGDKIIDNIQPAPKPKTKKCPFCAEEILAEARICRHCGHDLSKEYPKEIVKEQNFLGLTPVETRFLVILSIVGLSIIAMIFLVSNRFGISKEFKSNLSIFLLNAEKLDVMTTQGVSNPDFRNQLADVKSSYAQLENNWPSSLTDEKHLFDKAITGWELTLEVWDYDIQMEAYYRFPNVQLYSDLIPIYNDLLKRCADYTGNECTSFVSNQDWIGTLMGIAGQYFDEGKRNIDSKLK